VKHRNVLKSVILGLAVLALATLPPSASASVIGHLVVGICGGGGVTVSATTIDWAPGSPAACLQLGLGTNITSVGDGTLTGTSAPGTINDLNLALPGAATAGFMSFITGANLLFDLAPVGGFGPGSLVACAVDPGLNNSCSVPGSPFILTQTVSNSGVVGTSVTLDAHGTILDIGDGSTSFWSGSFTTQINTMDPAAIQTVIAGGGAITSSFSGEFDVTNVPEPVSMSLIGGGLIALAAIRRRKRA
jgi:hypothetical protein